MISSSSTACPTAGVAFDPARKTVRVIPSNPKTRDRRADFTLHIVALWSRTGTADPMTARRQQSVIASRASAEPASRLRRVTELALAIALMLGATRGAAAQEPTWEGWGKATAERLAPFIPAPVPGLLDSLPWERRPALSSGGGCGGEGGEGGCPRFFAVSVWTPWFVSDPRQRALARSRDWSNASEPGRSAASRTGRSCSVSSAPGRRGSTKNESVALEVAMLTMREVAALLCGAILIGCGTDPVRELAGPAFSETGVTQGNASGSGPVTGIGGSGTFDDEAVVTVTVQATRLPGGSGVGVARASPGHVHARVTQVVPPFGERDFWCITVQWEPMRQTLPLGRIYIRDTGDGITAFDEIVFRARAAEDCAAAPDPTRPFLTLLQGDYRVRPPLRDISAQAGR